MRRLCWLFFLLFPLFLIASANQFKLDTEGKVLSGKNAECQFQRIYDEKNNLICESWSNGLSLVKVYNEENQLVQIRFPHGKNLNIDGDTLEYDGHIRRALQRDDLGQVILEDFSDLDGTIEYFYDSDRLLQKVEGACIAISFPKQESPHLFDDTFRPVKIQGQDCVTNTLGQVLQSGNLTCEYDALGRLTKKITPERTIQFSYDEHSRPIRIHYDDTIVYNSYDAIGRKVEKETWQGYEKINHEYYLYDGIFEIAAFDENFHLKELRILDPKYLLRTAFLEQEGTISFPFCTQQGHTVALLYPNHEPDIVEDLPIFGEDPSKLLHSWAYTGHRYDPELRQYYFGGRHYDPEIISWTTPDPLRQVKTNLYSYLLGDPTHYVDLFGYSWIIVPIGEVLLEVGGAIVDAIIVSEATKSIADDFEDTYNWWQERKQLKEANKAELEAEKANKTKTEETKQGSDVYVPDRPLPKDERTKEPVPDTDARHTQLGTRESSSTGEKYPQAREFDKDGKPVKDVDFTDHNRSHNHPNPHQHKWKPNKTGGTPSRSKDAEPLDWEN